MNTVLQLIMPSGGLIQLVAYGAPDVYLIGNTDNPYASNHRDAMMHWFIDRESGHAEKDDMMTVNDMPNILDHVPYMMKPKHNSIEPFQLNTERACVKIQRAWKTVISNPSYKLCVNRLHREFKELC